MRRPASTPVFDVERHPVRPELQPWLEHLWTVTWNLGAGPAHESTVISFPALHLTVEWGTPGELRHATALPATLLHGVVSRVFRLPLRGAGGVLGARFTPGGFATWTGLDAAPLRDRAVEAGPLLPDLGALHHELPVRPAAERVAALGARLAAHPAAAPADTELTELVRRISADSTLLRVEQLVGLTGVSVRTLQRRFRSHLGVSPKWVLARARLQEAALALEQDPEVDLAELAVRLGWYDQAHLTNAFRRLLGETPAQYAARSRGSR